MPKAIGEFINELAQKAGVAVDNKDLVSLLAAPELMNVKVPDELVTSMDSGLLNIDAAKNNHPVIKSKYFADAYDGMDRHLAGLLTEDTLTPEDITEIKAEKSTAKKLELTISKLKAAKKADPTVTATVNRQIADLNEAVRIAKEAQTTIKNEYEVKIKDIHKEAALTSQFANYKTIYDDIPGNVKNPSLKAIVNQALQDNNAEFRTDENGTLQLVTKDGNNVFGSDHRQLTPQSFLDKTFAPILKVSVKTPQTTVTPVTPLVTPVNGAANTQFLQSHNQKALADLEKAPVGMI